MTVPGVFPYQREAGPVTDSTQRVVLADDSPGNGLILSSPAGTLSAPGQDAVVDLSANRVLHHVFTFDVLNLVATNNVVVGIFGKAAGETTRSRAGQNNATLTVNDRFLVTIANTPLAEVALRLVSETDPAVTIENIEYRGQE